MPTFSNYTTIQKAVELFNKQAYNVGFDFKVYTIEPSCLYVQASFDFSYYVNVDLEFREVFYTNISPDAAWPDAWYADQLFLLTEDELEDIIQFREIEIPEEKKVFGFVFNIIGKENYFINGTVICSEFYINWRHPNHNSAYIFDQNT
ncbi:MAG: hypothetical protein R2739_05360 [Chitinophagales bacterium]|nr:hypothetical protein [Bacteroidota bacterium]